MMVAAILIVILVRHREEAFNTNRGTKAAFAT
jgi:hypothetical protein